MHMLSVWPRLSCLWPSTEDAPEALSACADQKGCRAGIKVKTLKRDREKTVFKLTFPFPSFFIPFFSLESKSSLIWTLLTQTSPGFALNHW